MGKVFSNILVLIDCSSVDEAIISLVSDLAEQCLSKLTLIHVVHSHTADQDRSLKLKAEQWMCPLYERLQALGIPAEQKLLSGEPEEELLKEIENGTYDLVAMATHGHKAFSDLLFGSISDHLKHRISIPILMLKGQKIKSN